VGSGPRASAEHAVPHAALLLGSAGLQGPCCQELGCSAHCCQEQELRACEAVKWPLMGGSKLNVHAALSDTTGHRAGPK